MADGSARTVCVTHPFHPLFGRTFPFVEYRQTWGEDRVYFSDDTDHVRQLPATWTDAAPPDPFVAVSAGRATIRFADLLALAMLLRQLDDTDGARVPASARAEVA